jgi:uncharacterized Zn finger protein (UPF0148 family)
MKFCKKCGEEIYTRDGENVCPRGCKLTNSKASAQRKARHQVMVDLGLTRVRGAMGGVYYE